MVNMVRLLTGVAISLNVGSALIQKEVLAPAKTVAVHADEVNKKCKKMIEGLQSQWKKGILTISRKYLDSKDSDAYVDAAKNMIRELYGYDIGKVLFKPTLAAEHPFRSTFEDALSYFVGYDAVKSAYGYTEDKGFAINKGKGW